MDIQEIINKLEVVFNESTLGDIPFIQRDLKKIKKRLDKLEDEKQEYKIQVYSSKEISFIKAINEVKTYNLKDFESAFNSSEIKQSDSVIAITNKY